MLESVLTVAKVESGRASYYLSTTAAGADHAGGLLEPDGVWLGRQAAALGLSGVASPGAVRALFAGRSPVDGERLLAEPKRRRLSAYDCTFSTPKSVSVLFALGPPEVTEQVRLAHGGAVLASLDYLERHGARVREGQVDGADAAGRSRWGSDRRRVAPSLEQGPRSAPAHPRARRQPRSPPVRRVAAPR